jgi:hypothetical protein
MVSLSVNFLKLFITGFIITTLTQSVLAQDDEIRRSRSQVIDDSTKQIYGPNTSRYYYEKNIFYGDYKSQVIDTVIRDFHLYNFVQRLNYEYQDLGNIATAMSPIFYKLPGQIGVSTGWSGFDPFWDLQPIRYFDTHSPYSNMNLVLGGKGRSMTNVVYSRNIKPNWNFGFNYRGLFIDKQILRRAKGDRNVVSNYYDAFMTYHTKDSSYWVFGDFKRLRHKLLENGGVKVEEGFLLEDFFSTFAQPNLTTAENRDLRTNFHLYQQYKLKKALQVYHQVDKYRQYIEFVDGDPSLNTFYDTVILKGSKTFDRELFKTLRNEVGIKGNIGDVFYNGYWVARNFSMDYYGINENDHPIRTQGTEYYVGGRLRTNIFKKIQLDAEAEYLLRTNYRIKASVNSPWLEGHLARYLYKPTFVQQMYLGAHDVWLNDFDNIEVNQLAGLAHLRRPTFTLSAGGTFTILNNYVFFNEKPLNQRQKVLPQQSAGTQFIQSPEARFQVTLLKHITLSGRAMYNTLIENADDAIQLPEWFVHGQLAYQNIFFDGNFDIQIGVEAHWQSAYYANGYDVPTQQFYTQRSFLNTNFVVLDGFFNWKMKRGRIFLKYNNIVQAITKTGYFPTPFYPGQANILDFGFDWSFYD